MVVGSSPWACQRFPRLPLLCQPESGTRCSPAFGIWAVRAASQSRAETTSKFRFRTGCLLAREMRVPVLAWSRRISWEKGERRMDSARAQRPSLS